MSNSPVASVEGLTVFHHPMGGSVGNRKKALVGIIVLLLFLGFVCLTGRMVIPIASSTDFLAKNLSVSLEHPFGTDWMGRDMLARTLAGLSTSIFVGLLSAAISSVIAFVFACLAVFGGPAVDAAIDWLIDLVMGIPHIVLLILISYALGRGFWGVTVGVAVTHWPSLTRLLRAEIAQLKAQPYIACSRAVGTPAWRIAVSHMLPGIFPQYLVGLVLLFPHAILHEASITFLGFGLSPEQPAIGVILSESMSYLSSGSWWLAVFPGLSLLLIVLAFDRIGDLLRGLFGSREVQL